MRSSRNCTSIHQRFAGSLIDWKMRSSRNVIGVGTMDYQSLIDWKMRSSRNNGGAVWVRELKFNRLENAL